MEFIKYKIILLFTGLCFFTPDIFGQRQNDTWIFGENKWIIDNSGFTFSERNRYIKYGTASISDFETGALLFYTNGLSIWDKNENLMQNGEYLIGDPATDNFLQQFYVAASSCGQGNHTEQGTIIIPKPNSPTNYYVITSVSTQYPDCPANSNVYYGFGIRYAEVNMSANGGLGAVISKNNILQAGNTNSLTSVLANDGTSYWLVTSNGGDFYAYKVDANGIQISTPVISSFNFNITGSIKISPNGQYLVNNYKLYDFNTSTGVISNPLNIIPSGPNEDLYRDASNGPSNIEFSPNSNILYFSSVENLLCIDCYLTPGGISMYNISTGEIVGVNDAGKYVFPHGYNTFNLQLARNGKIYLIFNNQNYDDVFPNYIKTTFGWDNPSPPFNHQSYPWGVINNPDNWNPSNDPITMITTPDGAKNGYTFPPLITRAPPCINDLNITEDVLSGQTDIQNAANTLTATNIIFNGATAAYSAGIKVSLKPGFHARNGSDFRAFIEGCLPAGEDSEKKGLQRMDIGEEYTTMDYNALELYPNPVTDKLYLENTESLKAWRLYDYSGRPVSEKQLDASKSNKLEIDFNHFSAGVYFLNIYFQNGESLNRKIIKVDY